MTHIASFKLSGLGPIPLDLENGGCRSTGTKTPKYSMAPTTSVCGSNVYSVMNSHESHILRPRRPVTLNQGQYRPSWFDIARLPPRSNELDEQAIAESITMIEGLILSQVHSGIDSRRIILMGFSQGAALSMMVSLTTLHYLGGVVSLSGWIPSRARNVSLSGLRFPNGCIPTIALTANTTCCLESPHFMVSWDG